MRSYFRYKLLAIWLLIGLAGCVDPYLPDVPAAKQNYLVINGFINSQGSTTIQLTRSLQLNATSPPPAEAHAAVAIVAASGQRFALTESPVGTYTSANLNLNPTLTYKLSIVTAAGRGYETDFLPVKTTPAIDKVEWRYENNGVQLYADAHDAARATTYYRWQYEETWQFTSAYESLYRYNPVTKLVEPRLDDIYHCWRNVIATNVLQASTARLTQDVVTDFPLVFIPANSDKLRVKYSILVKLVAQTKDEFDYWETLRKNTESLGTINDPLPSQITGNVHCLSDASEPVLGFVGIHSVSEQRIFIAHNDVPQLQNVTSLTGYESCHFTIEEDRCPPYAPVRSPPGVTYAFDNPYNIICNYRCDSGSGCTYLNACTYIGAQAECVDCRLRGTNVRPSFWK